MNIGCYQKSETVLQLTNNTIKYSNGLAFLKFPHKEKLMKVRNLDFDVNLQCEQFLENQIADVLTLERLNGSCLHIYPNTYFNLWCLHMTKTFLVSLSL